MKILKYITLVLMAVVTFSSCEKSDSNPVDPPAPVENTVIMFLPWSGNSTKDGGLYGAFLGNIRNIEKAIVAKRSTCGARLFILISTSTTEGALIELKYNDSKRECVRDTIEKYKWPTEDPVAVMINRMQRIKELSPTPKYSMILGCHGMGWIPTQREQKQYSRYFGGISDDYRLTSEDLATALNYSGLRPQYILFDVCYMANIETAFDLRKSCDYLIASTSELMDYGMPYDIIWSELASTNPDYRRICEHFYTFYHNYSMPYGTLSVTKMSEVDEMVRLMNDVNSEYDCDMMIQDGILKLSNLQKLDGYSNSIYYDFGSYIDNLCQQNTAMADAVKSQLERLVPYKVNTDYIYGTIELRSGRTVKLNTFSGITISDPNQSYDNNAIKLKKYTNWWKATH